MTASYTMPLSDMLPDSEDGRMIIQYEEQIPVNCPIYYRKVVERSLIIHYKKHID